MKLTLTRLLQLEWELYWVKLTLTRLLQLEWELYWVFSISYFLWVLANIMTESSHWLQKFNRNSGYKGLPRFWADFYILVYTLHQELMKSMGSHGSSLLLLKKGWQSDTLCATPMRLWLHSLSIAFHLLLWTFLCNFIGILLLSPSDLLHHDM